MITMPGIVLACALFGAFYFIGRFIANKTTSSGRSTYILYAFLVLFAASLVLSAITEVNINEILGTTEGFFYLSAIFLGVYYGFVSIHRERRSDKKAG